MDVTDGIPATCVGMAGVAATGWVGITAVGDTETGAPGGGKVVAITGVVAVADGTTVVGVPGAAEVPVVTDKAETSVGAPGGVPGAAGCPGSATGG